MSLTPRFQSDLWRRLAEAQDLASADERSLRHVERAVTARVAGRLAGMKRRRLAARALLVAASLTAATGAFLAIQKSLLPERAQVDKGAIPALAQLDRRGSAREGAFVADARSDLPLRFKDGSTVTFRAGSAGRMQRLTGTGAEIVLERGWLDAHVVHADTTLWLVHAGPYRVRVTGTRFAVTWAPSTFELNLYEGAVIVDGAVLGAGVPLRAGHRLKISSGVVLIEPLTGGGDGPTSEHVVPPGRPPLDTEWLTLAERGDYRQALAAAKRLGWPSLCRRLDARRLLTLGDVARYAGAKLQARQAFQALVRRFPENRLSADAVFSLGRLASDAGRPREATSWFRRYVTDWPDAPLADQAAGRLLEDALRGDDKEAARSAARRYLARAPAGPHATLAREVLEQSHTRPQIQSSSAPADGP